MKRFALIIRLFLFLFAQISVASAEEKVRVDVMVVYTPAVASFYNGHDGIAAHIYAAMAGTNEILKNSEAPMFFHLAHVAEVDYEEADSLADDLNRLRFNADGHMDEVHEWRSEFGADVICLFRRGAAGGVAGRAHLLNDLAGNAGLAYSVVSDVSALSNFTLAHELGHNLGAAHAEGDPGDSGIFGHSRGHRFLGQDGSSYRTVMAYVPGARIPHFSNPEISYAGTPTGIPRQQTGSADVVGTFGAMVPTVAAYLPEHRSGPRILSEPPDVTVVEGSRAILSATINGVPPLDVQWFEGETGDEQVPVAGATDAGFQTDAIYTTSHYWVKVSNAEGETMSRAAKVRAAPKPAGPYAVTAEQPIIHNGYRVNKERWQFFVPEAGYLDSISVRLWKVGDPGGVRVEILDPRGFRLAEHTMPGSSIPGSSTWGVVPAEFFVAPGQSYRIRLTPVGTFSDADYVVWAGQENGYPEGSSSLDGSTSGYAFTFRVQGTIAWTYDTWLVEQGLTGDEAKPTNAENAVGLPNLLRYVLNQDTSVNVGGFLSVGSLVVVDGARYLPFEFRQRKGVQDAAVVVEASADLLTWEAIPAGDIYPLPGTDSQTARFRGRVPLPDGQKAIFLRLNASLRD